MAHPKRHLILFLVLAAVLHAQPYVPAALSVRLLSWEGELHGLWFERAAQTAPLSVKETEFSPAVSFPTRPPSLRVLAAKETATGLEKTTLAEIPLPAEGTQFALLLAPAHPGSPHPFSARLIDASPSAHPSETIRVLNLSDKTLGLRIGGKTGTLDTGADILFPFPDTGAPTVPVEIAVRTGVAWQMVSRGLRPAPSSGRIFCLVRNGRASADDPGLAVDSLFIIDEAPASAPPSLAQR